MHTIVEQLKRTHLDSGISGMTLAIVHQGRLVCNQAVGHARLPDQPMTVDTVFDLASVTKPIAGGLLAAHWHQAGLLRFSDPIRRFLPKAHRGICVGQLLDHTSGYPAWLPFYEAYPQVQWGSPSVRQDVLYRAQTTPLQAAPGTRHTYSDVGFITLAAILEEIGGPLEHQVAQLIAGPLDKEIGYHLAPHHTIAATEQCPVRDRMIQGEVHDLNTACMGGVSTHAGLFSTAATLALIGHQCIDATKDGSPLAGEALRKMWTHTSIGHHKLGWDGISTGYSSTGDRWPNDGVGHLGFTGTSLWLAPNQQLSVALCTNRVHPNVDPSPIREARPQVHNAIAAAYRLHR